MTDEHALESWVHCLFAESYVRRGLLYRCREGVGDTGGELLGFGYRKVREEMWALVLLIEFYLFSILLIASLALR